MQQRVYNLLEYDKIIERLSQLAASAPGRQLCRALEPGRELSGIDARQDETEDAVRHLLEKGNLPFSGISEIRPAVRRSETGAVLSCRELLTIGAFLRAVARLKAVLSDAVSPEDQASDLPPRLTEARIRQLELPKPLLARIESSIAGEDELHDQASPELYTLRRRIRQAQRDVKEKLDQIVRSRSSALQDQLVTLRGGRYVVPVKAEHRGEVSGLVHDTSSSGNTLFIEPMAVVELNNKIRELEGLEREEIERILAELSGLVAEQTMVLLMDAEILAQLDFAMAKGQLALQMQAVRPLLNDDGRIILKQARHPLIAPERVVPIDFELGTHFRTLVITGPNTGGKTVTLKTCGLLSLMGMAGLQIPARAQSEISVFQRVLADIGDEQSIEQDLSTFSSHLRQIIEITDLAGPKTLVLVDELGAGTDPSEGAALAIAILDHIRQKGSLTVATTHYKELKGYALNTPQVENACCEFDTQTLQPTYRLLIGVPGVSNAFAISQRLGLNKDIIDEARRLISDEGAQFEQLVAAIEQSHHEAQRRSQEIEALRAESEAARAQLARDREELAQTRRTILQKAREEAREILDLANLEADVLLEDFKAELAQQHRPGPLKSRQELRRAQREIHAEIGRETLAAHGGSVEPDRIEIGQTLYAPTFGVQGVVRSLADNKGNLQLQAGNMVLTVPAASLTELPEEQEAAAEQAPPKSRRGRMQQAGRSVRQLSQVRRHEMSSELMLLGKTVEEALQLLDKYLDDAILGGISSARIVHGKGTGALRAAVTDALRRDRRIKSFRLGQMGEGDSGVTIVEFA